MSSVVKASGRKRIDSHEISDIPEFCTRIYPPDETDQIPFQEFLDNDVNNEKWETAVRASIGPTEKFQDIYTVLLPPSLQGYEWVPLEDLFPNTDFIIKDSIVGYPDLLRENQHLLHSEFIRSFISSIETLYYLGNIKPFVVEYTSELFSPSFEKEKWRPWHHIYSNCSSGKNYNHLPTANKQGKYIVRLYWLGSWKKIYISDRLPVNIKNQLLLPCLYNPDNEDKESMSSKTKVVPKPKKKVLEIWPFLLAKALMILASLTWTAENELVDFDIIQCLTGWISHKIDVTNRDPLDVWQLCMDHTVQYTWSNDDRKMIKEKSSQKVTSGRPNQVTSLKMSKRDFPYKTLRSESRTGTTKKSYMHVRPKEEAINKNKFVVVVGIELNGLTEQFPTMDFRPWIHGFLAAQTRTVPILKPSIDEEYEAWKRFRWIDWAIENNLINPRCPPNPIRSFRTVDPFRYKYQYLFINQDDERHSSNPSSGVKGRKHPSLTELKENENTEWLDLEYIENILQYVKIYYIPSTYKSKVRISNLSSENINKEPKYPFAKSLIDLLELQWKEIIRPQTLQSHRNEPFYIFCDSLFPQNIVINLNQTGYLKTITERFVEKEVVKSDTDSECGLCVTTMLERVKRNYYRARSEKKEEVRKSIVKVIPNIDHSFPEASIILSNFRWDSNRSDDFLTSLVTLGSGCIILNLKPGRRIFTMWVKVEGSYSVQVLSDSCLCVGSLEETLTLMSRDSLLFREAYWSMVEHLQLVISCFGTQEYMTELNEFYKSFKPNCDTTKKELLDIQEVFFKEFFETVFDTLGPEALRVVKILFRKWQLKSSNRCNINDVSELCYLVDEEDMMFVNIMQESAVKIQSYFRGIYERILMRHHNPLDKFYEKTAAGLALVGDKFMHNDRKLGASVMRKFIRNNTIPDLKSKYSWCETLANDICTAQFTAHNKITDTGWIFICRHIFYICTSDPLIIRINIFCNLSQYFLKVYDNDTTLEMKEFVNNVAVNEYPPNIGGYTAVAYGWATTGQSYVHYKIIFACRQDNIDDLLSFSLKTTKKEILSDFYIPNTYNTLCRYILELNSMYTIVTIHLSTDYPKVKMKLWIFNTATPDNKLIEVTGIGSVTVPSLVLGNCQKHDSDNPVSVIYLDNRPSIKPSKIIRKKSVKDGNVLGTISAMMSPTNEEAYAPSNYYIIEAFIEKDSWPLTAGEWINVEKERDKREIGQTGSKKKEKPTQLPGEQSARRLSKSSILPKRDGPKWTMEVLYNHTDLITFHKDPTRDDFIKNTKQSWFTTDPSIYALGQKLRTRFITENSIVNPDWCTDPDTRSLNKEIFFERILPPLDFTPYLIKPINEVKERHLKTEGEMWSENFETLFKYTDSIIDLDFSEKDKNKFFKNELKKIENINEWFEGVRKDSEYMMEKAYKLRKRYIESFKINGKRKSI